MISALEGFRDVKASLASGALILVSFWILFAGHFSSPAGEGSLWADIRACVSFIGTPAMIAGLTFLAYLLGVVLSLDRLLFSVLDKWKPNFSALNSDSQARLATRISSDIEELTMEVDKTYDQLCSAAGLSDTVTEEDEKKLLKELGAAHPGVRWANGSIEVLRRRILQHLLDEMKRSMDLIPIHLHSANIMSAERYEKASAEASFRGALALPLLFLTGALAFRFIAEDLWFSATISILIGLVLAAVVVLRAREKRVEASEELAKAVTTGLVPCPGYAELRRSLEEKKSLGLGLGI